MTLREGYHCLLSTHSIQAGTVLAVCHKGVRTHAALRGDTVAEGTTNNTAHPGHLSHVTGLESRGARTQRQTCDSKDHILSR